MDSLFELCTTIGYGLLKKLINCIDATIIKFGRKKLECAWLIAACILFAVIIMTTAECYTVILIVRDTIIVCTGICITIVGIKVWTYYWFIFHWSHFSFSVIVYLLYATCNCNLDIDIDLHYWSSSFQFQPNLHIVAGMFSPWVFTMPTLNVNSIHRHTDLPIHHTLFVLGLLLSHSIIITWLAIICNRHIQINIPTTQLPPRNSLVCCSQQITVAGLYIKQLLI